MMFAMLVGTPPFETKSLGRTYSKIAANEYEIPDRLSPSAKTFISMLLHPDPKLRGHLHQPGHPSDLLSHAFFLSGFCPKQLPQSSATQPPILPLDTVLNENHIQNSNNLNMDLTDGSSSPGSKFKTTLRQKFSQMFHTSSSLSRFVYSVSQLPGESGVEKIPKFLINTQDGINAQCNFCQYIQS